MTMMKSMPLAALLLAAGASGGWAQTVASPNTVSGSYKLQGTALDGSNYSGTAEIRTKGKDDCRIERKTTSTAVGACLVRGNLLVVGYGAGDDRTLLMVFIVKPGGTLEGKWKLQGAAGVGTERLEPDKLY